MARVLWTVANAFSPEYRRFQRNIAAFVRLDPARAAVRSQESLHKYLTYCRTYSPYWRERWPKEAANFAIEEADHVLKLLPPLSKSDLREHASELRILRDRRKAADGFPDTPRQTTIRSGGSTGMPVSVTIDSNYSARNRATCDFFYRLCGLHPGEPFFYIWGSPNELSDLKNSPKKRMSMWLRGAHPIPAFALSPARIRAVQSEVERYRSIHSAVCFASAVETIANYAEREKLRFRRLRRIFTGGGLLHEPLRCSLQKHLADEVFNTYGTRDLGMIAHETPAHDGLAIAEWFNKVEILDADSRPVAAGELGQVHVTAINNFSHALIRVAMGDMARWQPDKGRNPVPTSRICELAGRTAEQLIGPGEIVIDPSAVIHLVGVLIAPAWLRKFQLVQHTPSRYVLRVEAWDDSASPTQLDELQSRVQKELSHLFCHSIDLKVQLVGEIPPLPSGKHQYCKVEPEPASVIPPLSALQAE